MSDTIKFIDADTLAQFLSIARTSRLFLTSGHFVSSQVNVQTSSKTFAILEGAAQGFVFALQKWRRFGQTKPPHSSPLRKPANTVGR
jgi:hypothetical protein